MKLSEIGEKKALEKIASFLDIGDDAAYLPYGEGYLILSSDMIYKKTHVLPGMSPAKIGSFIVSINASDIAAMGAKPLAFLLSYGGPDTEYSEYEELVKAANRKCAEYGMKYAGGDTKETDELTLAGFCVGECEKPVLRSGAKPGDVIAVTGDLGAASLGAELLVSSLTYMEEEEFHDVIKKACEPEARVEEGLILSKYASAMCDISDGLSVSLHDIACASGAGFELDVDCVPVSGPAKRLCEDTGKEALGYALYGGGDYELLFTVPEELFCEIEGRVKATAIGRMTKKGFWAKKGGSDFSFEKIGYEHFKRNL